ncbi:putative ABC transport system permease protein [Saccharothrix tamanrassetensis]|uniref:Putative ABC transport system permease protein n=1 Tax=Saccharothrix tamanrassetensis TaxID=1051531 RepID=A0A841CXI5_9PSEU|nr:ABC transporter permease [Saccharothrix tamanrassetensis]MBB5960697.1 putative ABC transport system permease protein [Saccharothrix tamanrassetensis]
MLRTVVAGLTARPRQLLLSAVAIALGVAFVSGAFVLSDAVDAGLREAVAFETRGVDASIGRTRGGPDLEDQVLADVRRVPGVAAAEGRTTVSAPLRDAAGRPQDSAATSLPADERLRPFDLAEGRFPDNAGEVVMERGTAAGHPLGQPVTVFGQDGRLHSFTLVGTFDRPAESGIGAAPLVLLPEALHRLEPGAGFSEIVARAVPGVGQPQLVADITRALDRQGISVVTGREAAAQLLSQIAPDSAEAAGFFTAFAVLAMIVAAMVIANSFTILVTQRTRELALLRCVGAGRRQVFAGVLAEASVVGAVASVVGLFGGLGVAAALQAVAGALGGHEAAVHVPLTARTVVAALAVGVLVTALAAALPAWTATRVAPIEALRTPVEGKSARAGRSRAVSAVVLLVVGVGAAVFALRADVQDGAVLSIAAMVALLGAMLAVGPLVAGPVVRTLGTLCSPLFGLPAKLAALNADRNPKRTAASAAALTIGLAVVALVTTVTAGVEASRNRGLDQQVTADFIVTSVIGTRPLPATLADTLAAVPGVAIAAPRQSFSADLGAHGGYGMTAVRGDALGSLLRPAVLSGRLDRLDAGELAVSKQLAEETGLAVGDTVRAGRRDSPVPLRVVAVYDGGRVPGADLGLGLVDLGQLPAVAAEGSGYDGSVLVGLVAGTDAEEVRPVLERALSDAPLARLNSVADLRDQLAAPLRSTLDLLWALTALAVLIAFAGIANTLSLSVLERTRESALLRALGLTRGGLRAALTAESVFVALLGATCGLLLGVGSAWLISRVASTDAEPVLFTLPWGRLGVLLGAAVLAAPLAALVPARRAARVSLTAGMAEQ